MKKNIVFGMLVSLLAIPMYTQAQEAAIENDSASAEAVAPVKKVKPAYTGPRYSAGSVISVGFGAGCGGMRTSGDNIKSSMSYPTYNVNLRYTYFFRNFMGFTTGVEFSTYQSLFALTGILNWDATTMGTNPGLEPTAYQHRLNFDAQGDKGSKWSEIESVAMVEVPIALSFKAKPNRVGFLGTVGLKLGFPVTGSYKYSGTLNHYGAFDDKAYDEINPGRYVMNDTYENVDAIKYNKKVWNVLNCGVFAEAGILFQVHPRVDMSLSIYGNYYINSVNGTPTEQLQKLGFASANNQYGSADNGEMQSIMNPYNGLIGTDVVDRINPFSCGVKLALHINCREKTDEQIAAENTLEPKVVYVYDTINTISVEIVHDTLVQEVRIPCEEEAEPDTKEYIYYKVGDATTPIFQPTDLLEKLAARLLADPEAKVIVAGHSSPEGDPVYNEILAQKRADKIAQMLMAKGVQKYQLVVRSYGSERPSNLSGMEALVKDRRVEIIPDRQPTQAK